HQIAQLPSDGPRQKGLWKRGNRSCQALSNRRTQACLQPPPRGREIAVVIAARSGLEPPSSRPPLVLDSRPQGRQLRPEGLSGKSFDAGRAHTVQRGPRCLLVPGDIARLQIAHALPDIPVSAKVLREAGGCQHELSFPSPRTQTRVDRVERASLRVR